MSDCSCHGCYTARLALKGMKAFSRNSEGEAAIDAAWERVVVQHKTTLRRAGTFRRGAPIVVTEIKRLPELVKRLREQGKRFPDRMAAWEAHIKRWHWMGEASSQAPRVSRTDGSYETQGRRAQAGRAQGDRSGGQR